MSNRSRLPEEYLVSWNEPASFFRPEPPRNPLEAVQARIKRAGSMLHLTSPKGKRELSPDIFLRRLPKPYQERLAEFTGFATSLADYYPGLGFGVIAYEGDSGKRHPGDFVELLLLDKHVPHSEDRFRLARTIRQLYQNSLTGTIASFNVTGPSDEDIQRLARIGYFDPVYSGSRNLLYPYTSRANVTFNGRSAEAVHLNITLSDPASLPQNEEISRFRADEARFAVLKTS